jgi:hypothetical protein
LAHNNKLNEAKGIMQRHGVESYIRIEVKERLENLDYDESQDSSLYLYDEFEPLSRPIEEYIKLPDNVKLEWIGSEEDVPKLSELLSEPYIGMDSEWRPELS